jgi:tetratricopeptide (TPR) repeat protein
VKQLNPPDSHHLSSAIGWHELGNWKEAFADIERIHPKFRTHPDVLEVTWQIHAKAKNWEKAIETARTITQQDPELPFGWIHLAYSLHELRKTQDAYDTLHPVYERFPDEWLMRYNMACYACQLGKLEEARKWLDQALAGGNKKEIQELVAVDPDLEPLQLKSGEI